MSSTFSRSPSLSLAANREHSKVPVCSKRIEVEREREVGEGGGGRYPAADGGGLVVLKSHSIVSLKATPTRHPNLHPPKESR